MDPNTNNQLPNVPPMGPAAPVPPIPAPMYGQPLPPNTPNSLPVNLATAAQAYPQAPPTMAPPSMAPPPIAGVAPGAPMGTANPQANRPVPAVAVKSNPNSTQNALQIAEIRDGIVIMNDGSFRSVIMVKSINFDLMSPQEREAVEYSYQGFLNSLYFPVQIFIRSQKVDIQPYIEKLDKIRSEHDNMLLAVMMEDYINYIGALAEQTNIMDKKFYVVIPYFPELDIKKALDSSRSFLTGIKNVFGEKEHRVTIDENALAKAKDELRNRVQATLSGLMQCGIQGLPLDTQELIELYYDTYNPDTATRQQLKNFNDLTAPVITKGQGNAPQPNLDKEL